jgi:hypothetical protein
MEQIFKIKFTGNPSVFSEMRPAEKRQAQYFLNLSQEF